MKDAPLYDGLLTLPTNNRPGWKALTGTNHLAFGQFVSYKKIKYC
jgi:hypothetical protein